MALRIRLARGGAKKKPYYRIVVAEAHSPRDGRFVERVGSYNPILGQDHPDRLSLNDDRCRYWMNQGALPTERVALFFSRAGLIPAQAMPTRPKKSQPKKKAQERLQKQAQA